MIAQTSDDRLLVDTAEAARLLSVSAKTVTRLIAAGELKPIRMGRAVRVSIRSLKTMIESQEAAT